MSFPRYPKYKESGAEWLEGVPDHWAIGTLGRFTISRCDGPFGSGLKSEHYVDAGVRVIRLQNIKSTGFDGSNEAFIDEDYCRKELGGHDVQQGDLLIAGLGDENNRVGRACVAPAGIEPAMVKADCFRFRLDTTKLLPRFAALYLTASSVADAGLLSSGSTRSRIPLFATSSRMIAVPPRTEQQSICDFLDRETSKIDALVTEQRRLLELLKEKRQAVISHAVTKGLNPDAPMKDSGIEWLGEVPAHWGIRKLGYGAFMQEGPGLRTWQFTSDGIRVICVTNIAEGGIDFSRLEKFISEEEYSASYSHFTVKKGDILLSSSGNSWGKVAIFADDEPVVLNTSTIRLNESDGAPIIRDYIALQLQSESVREQLALAMTGSCQPNFGPTHLNAVMVPIPPKVEQVSIVESLEAQLSRLAALMSEAQRAIDLLLERRTALISAAVAGQIDVRNLQPESSTA